MSRFRSSLLVAAALSCLGSEISHHEAKELPTEAPQGAVVDQVVQGWAGDRMGFRPGDQILSWVIIDGEPAQGRRQKIAVQSPFDLYDAEVEFGSRHTIQLEVVTPQKKRLVDVPPGDWRLTLRPTLSAESVASYRAAIGHLSRAETEPGLEIVNRLLESPEFVESLPRRTWLLLQAAITLVDSGQPEDGLELFEAARREARESSDRRLERTLWRQWGLTVRKVDIPKAARAFQESLDLLETDQQEPMTRAFLTYWLGTIAYDSSKFDEAETLLRDAIQKMRLIAPQSLALARSIRNLGNVFLERGDLDAAKQAYEEGLGIIASNTGAALERVSFLRNLSIVASQRGDLEKAEELTLEAITVLRDYPSARSLLADTLFDFGNLAFWRGDLKTCEQRYLEATEIVETDVPGSLTHAKAIENLGILANAQQDLPKALGHLRHAADIFRRQAPNSARGARTTGFIGVILDRMGRLAEAEKYYEEAVSILAETVPRSDDYAGALHNLAILQLKRGNVRAAEKSILQSNRIREEGGFGGEKRLLGLQMMATLETTRGNLAAAEEYCLQALDQAERLGEHETARALSGLARIFIRQGKLDKAEQTYEKALVVDRRHYPNSLWEASDLSNLGWIRLQRGDLKEAETLLRQSLELTRKHADGSLKQAEPLEWLAELKEREGDLDRALEFGQRALEIRQTLSPESASTAWSFYRVARLLRKAGRVDQAIATFDAAMKAYEGQITQFGGPQELQVGLVDDFAVLSEDAIDLLVERGEPSRAFEMLERSRVRVLLRMLAERDLEITGEIPPKLEEERRFFKARYEEIQGELAELSTEKADLIRLKTTQLEKLRLERERTAENIRQMSAHLAALRYPEPFTLERAAQALDPETVLLSYSVHRDKTYLFVVTRAGLATVETISLGSSELASLATRLRELVTRMRAGSATLDVDSGAFRRISGRLFAELIGPAAQTIEGKKTVLISPDGPLHLLPFACLLRSEADAPSGPGKQRFFAEWRPIHFIQSATLYAQTKSGKSGPASKGDSLIAFGNPNYAKVGQERPSSLPWSLVEVESIAREAMGPIEVHLGDEATESRAKSIGKDHRFLHFALHVELNESSPMQSALLFSNGIGETGTEDGRLETWEIFEELRIDADLVVLSACESALGKLQAGEGLIGLSRAFQFAGGRTVLASLWRVADQGTSQLMVEFYRRLREGAEKHEALRRAQIHLINSDTALSLPYYWASFQLIGDK